jgi:deoxyribonuclease-4
MFGSHLSISGSMLNALHEGERLGMETVQVFTKNQQQWRAKPLDPAMVRDWHAEVQRLGWQGRIVSHASYLINLAAYDDDLFQRSIDLMTDEIERCEELAIPFLVHHPGSFVHWPGDDGLARGIARIADAYREIFKRTRGSTTISCFEGTVGAGSQIGGRFEHLRDLRDAAAYTTGEPARLAFCLDTCHMHAAGYDLASRETAELALAEFDQRCGLTNLKVLHLNDSKGKLASKLDRHEHIGEGWIGGGASLHSGIGAFSASSLAASGFAAILAHPAMSTIPKILETPKGTDALGANYDTINLTRLKALIGVKHATPSVEGKPATKQPPSKQTKRTSRTGATPPKPNKPVAFKQRKTAPKGEKRRPVARKVR